MPLLIFKAAEGMCDRLQVLLHCIQYCVRNKAALHVDWDDVVWGGGEFGFDQVFMITGIPIATRRQVAKLVANRSLQIRPPCWDFRKIMGPTSREVLGNEYIGEFMGDAISRSPGDILVTNGNGVRVWDVNYMIDHVRVAEPMLSNVRALLNNFDPECYLVHLRGTDRPDEGYVDNSIAYFKDDEERSRAPIYVITDQKSLWDKFSAGVPTARLLNPSSSVLDLPEIEHGSHQMSSEALKKRGKTKWEMVVNSFTEWTALVYAKAAVGRGKSTYFEMARALNGQGVEKYSKIFGGWIPPKARTRFQSTSV